MCIGKSEVIPRLKYGRAKFYLFRADTFRFVIRKAAPGKCDGKKLGAVTRTVTADANQTFVIWKPGRKVKIAKYINDLTVPEGQAKITLRHTARAPAAINVWVWEHVQPAVDEYPPTIGGLKKGASSRPVEIILQAVHAQDLLCSAGEKNVHIAEFRDQGDALPQEVTGSRDAPGDAHRVASLLQAFGLSYMVSPSTTLRTGPVEPSGRGLREPRERTSAGRRRFAPVPPPLRRSPR